MCDFRLLVKIFTFFCTRTLPPEVSLQQHKKTGIRLGNGKQHVQGFMKADIVPWIFCLKNLILLRLLYPQCKNYNPQEEMAHLNTHSGQMKSQIMAPKYEVVAMYKIQPYTYKYYTFTIFFKLNCVIYKNLVRDFVTLVKCEKKTGKHFLSSCLHSLSGKSIDAPKGG